MNCGDSFCDSHNLPKAAHCDCCMGHFNWNYYMCPPPYRHGHTQIPPKNAIFSQRKKNSQQALQWWWLGVFDDGLFQLVLWIGAAPTWNFEKTRRWQETFLTLLHTVWLKKNLRLVFSWVWILPAKFIYWHIYKIFSSWEQRMSCIVLISSVN